MTAADPVAAQEARLAEIEACLGEAAARYVRNKARGGQNGKKGSLFEEQFTAFKVAHIAVEQLRALSEWPYVEEQSCAFVDDLLVTTSTSSKYHQLKNVAALTWDGGDHPLATDFESQAKLCRSRKEGGVTTTLVVSKPDVHAAMREAIPAAIAAHTEVAHFPYDNGSFNRLVLEYEPLREVLEQLTRVEGPEDDDLANAFGALIISTKKNVGRTSVEDLLASAQEFSPSLLRLFPWQMAGFALDSAFVNVLAEIDGLQYGCERGFFRWDAFQTSGVLSFNCLSPQFARFQSRIAEASPTDFDAFEKLLP